MAPETLRSYDFNLNVQVKAKERAVETVVKKKASVFENPLALFFWFMFVFVLVLHWLIGKK